MSKPDIFIFGASDHARVVIDIVEREGRFSIIGLFDSFKTRGTIVAGHEVLGNEDDLVAYASGCGLTHGIIGIGDNAVRQRIGHELRRRIPSIEYVTAVHPSSTLSGSVDMGGGAIVMARCYVGLDTVVGEGAVIATNSIFEHDGVIGPYATLGAGSTTGGHVSIGEGSGICLGVTIIHGIRVGCQTVIGAGSCVIDDVPSNVVAYGSPAKVIRARDQNSSYLHIRSASYISS